MDSDGPKNLETHISLMVDSLDWGLSMQMPLWQHEPYLVNPLHLVVERVGLVHLIV